MRYTKCASLQDYKDHFASIGGQGPVWPMLLNSAQQGLLFGALGAGIGALFGGIPALVLGWIFFNYGFVSGFCDQWLNWRLICIEPNTCVAGRVAWIETVDKKFDNDFLAIEYFFDNDLSFNVRMMPFNFRTNGAWEFDKDSPVPVYTLPTITASGYEAGKRLQAGENLGLTYEGYEARPEGDRPAKPEHPGGRWTMHCEIEGNGMYLLCTWAKAIAVTGPIGQGISAVAGGILVGYTFGRKAFEEVWKGCKKACKIPIFCDIVCAIASAAAAVVAAYVGFIVGAVLGALPGLGPLLLGMLISWATRHDGDWRDVQNNPEAGTIEENDCVVVLGDEVYDAGHPEGWAEIHPVVQLQKMCSLKEGEPDCCEGVATGSAAFKDPGTVARVNDLWNRWCTKLKEGRDQDVIRRQSTPSLVFTLHPLVDGCQEPRDHVVIK